MVHWKKIQRLITETNFRYVVGVSGGADSMFLLDFIKNLNIEFVVVHFNHGIRDTANRDHRFVHNYCIDNRITHYVGYGDTDKILNSKSIEAECRNQRYTFMEDVVRKLDYDRIITAHHADDQIETILMRLMRGCAFDNLAMAVDNGLVFRPFLNLPKEIIIKQCKNRRIPWMEDETNMDTKFERNWLRHSIIPQLMDRRNISNIARNALANDELGKKYLL